MSDYRNITAADSTPDSLTRQWFAEGSVSKNGESKHTKGSVFGTYAVVVNNADGSGFVIPLVNQTAVDRADQLAADPAYTVQRLRDQRLVEVRVKGSSKPKVTNAQADAIKAMLAGTATPEQTALLAGLVG